jgi:hypothetical protein
VSFDAETEGPSHQPTASRSARLRAADNSSKSRDWKKNLSVPHDYKSDSDEKEESMIEAVLRLEEKQEKEGFGGGVLAIISLLFGGWSGR